MNHIVLAVLMAGALLMSPNSWAQTGPAEPDDNHFSFNRVGDGYLRLDQRNGDISLCNHGSTGWVCELVPATWRSSPAVGDQGVPFKTIAEAIAGGLDVPTDR